MRLYLVPARFFPSWHGHLNISTQTCIWHGRPFASTFLRPVYGLYVHPFHLNRPIFKSKHITGSVLK